MITAILLVATLVATGYYFLSTKDKAWNKGEPDRWGNDNDTFNVIWLIKGILKAHDSVEAHLMPDAITLKNHHRPCWPTMCQQQTDRVFQSSEPTAIR